MPTIIASRTATIPAINRVAQLSNDKTNTEHANNKSNEQKYSNRGNNNKD